VVVDEESRDVPISLRDRSHARLGSWMECTYIRPRRAEPLSRDKSSHACVAKSVARDIGKGDVPA